MSDTVYVKEFQELVFRSGLVFRYNITGVRDRRHALEVADEMTPMIRDGLERKSLEVFAIDSELTWVATATYYAKISTLP